MDYEQLLAKREELEFKIDKLNESLRFGSSGNISGVEALAKMKENLKLVNEAIAGLEADGAKPAVQEEVAVQEEAPQAPTPEPILEPQAPQAPAAAAGEEVVAAPEEVQLGTS